MRKKPKRKVVKRKRPVKKMRPSKKRTKLNKKMKSGKKTAMPEVSHQKTLMDLDNKDIQAIEQGLTA